jgi:hypothetical protein
MFVIEILMKIDRSSNQLSNKKRKHNNGANTKKNTTSALYVVIRISAIFLRDCNVLQTLFQVRCTCVIAICKFNSSLGVLRHHYTLCDEINYNKIRKHSGLSDITFIHFCQCVECAPFIFLILEIFKNSWDS